jgi:hypothetical protein
MRRSHEPMSCVSCGSVRSAELVPRPGVGSYGVVDRHWVRECWVCGFQWDEFAGSAAS